MYSASEPTEHVVHRGDVFAHEHASEISRWALRGSLASLIVIDLSEAVDTTTAALAALILLRKTLLGRGRDMHLAGLTGRPLQLFAVNRLETVLPRKEVIADLEEGNGLSLRPTFYMPTEQFAAA